MIVYECLSINLFITVTPSSLPPLSHKIWMINDCYGELYVGPLPSIPSPLLIAAASSFLKEPLSIPLVLVGLFIITVLVYLLQEWVPEKGWSCQNSPLRFYTQVGWEKFWVFCELLNWEDVRLELSSIMSHSTFHFSSTKGISLFTGILKKEIQVGFLPKTWNCIYILFTFQCGSMG